MLRYMFPEDKNIFEKLNNIPKGYEQNCKPTKWDSKSDKKWLIYQTKVKTKRSFGCTKIITHGG